MPNHLPPSGPWTGYFLYGHEGRKHSMSLSLVFAPDGKIHGEGVDDIGPFAIEGIFQTAANAATWTKAYVGMHSVEYSGLYGRRSICGDWAIGPAVGGFWIWPGAIGQSDQVETLVDLELPLEPEIA